MGDRGRGRSGAQTAWHVLKHRTKEKGRRLRGAALPDDANRIARQRGQKPDGALKNSRTETFRPSRI